MRTAAKVFIWICMILKCVLIFPIVIGIFALEKLNTNTPKSELQNFGVLTMFLCSFFGGLFMILIDDAESKEPETTIAGNKIITKYEKIPQSKEELRAEIGKKVTKYSRLCFGLIALFTMICLILSVLSYYLTAYIFDGFYWDYYLIAEELSRNGMIITTVPSAICVVFCFVALVMFIHNKRWVNLPCNIALIVNLIPQFTLFICSMCLLILGYDSLFWSILTLSFISIALTITTICINYKVFEVKRRKIVVTSLVEIELEEIKRLQDKNVINQNEYDKMREALISKYY